MKIALLSVDSKIPNYALMKVARYYSDRGHEVEWYTPFEEMYDEVWMSKVFSFTEDYEHPIINAKRIIKGGTGYDIHSRLPDKIDACEPLYSIYPNDDGKTAYGFLTRGCPNKCKWCVVPQKEGNVKPYRTVEQVAIEGRNKLILFDNNILASDYGLQQIEFLANNRKYAVDFNQAIDARLVTDDIAQLLAKIRWIKRIRFGCDTPKQIEDCERAIELINKYGYKGEYFMYCILLDDLNEAYSRINHWRKKGNRYLPHAQPFRDINNSRQIIPQWQRDLARWCDRKELFRVVSFEDYEPRKGFLCKEYFNQ